MRLRNTVKHLTLFGLVLALTACGAGPLLRPGEPVGVLEIINNSEIAIGTVLLVDCDGSTYGDDRLPDDFVIEHGKSYKFNVSAGCWSILAYSVRGAEVRGQSIVNAKGVSKSTIGPPKKSVLDW